MVSVYKIIFKEIIYWVSYKTEDVAIFWKNVVDVEVSLTWFLTTIKQETKNGSDISFQCRTAVGPVTAAAINYERGNNHARINKDGSVQTGSVEKLASSLAS